MRAVQVTSLDGPQALAVVEIEEPSTDDGVLVDVHAAGVSFPDLLMTRGQYQRKPDVPFIPGVEVAGIVRAAAAGCGFATGDRVAAFVRIGGWAETIVAAPSLTFALPADLSFRSGAGMVMNYLTAHLALTRRGGTRAGETVLVHGAAGGLGTALLQVAAAIGARTIAVVSTPEKASLALASGAHEAVLLDGWREEVSRLTGGRGVDVIADPVGGDRFTDSVRSLAREGRLLVLGFAAGAIPTVAANRLLLNNIDARGVAWGSLIEHEPDYPAEQWRALMAYHRAGFIRPIDGASHRLEDAANALGELDDRTATGKITLAVRT